MTPAGFESGRFVWGAQTVPIDLFGNRRYGAIYADPSWRFDTYSDKGRGRSPDWVERAGALPLLGVEETVSEEKHYPTMSTEEICALPVGDLAADNSILYMWATFNMLPDALQVGAAWGFEFVTSRVWAKTGVHGFNPSRTLEQNFPMGCGYVARGNPEPLLIFKRGAPRYKGSPPRALIFGPRREHSRKPDGIHAEIEAQADGPYLELFARSGPKNWCRWGNQVDRFASTGVTACLKT